MLLKNVSINAPLPKALTLLHVADTHLLLTDEMDGVRQRQLADLRTQYHLDASLSPLDIEAERARVAKAVTDLLDYGKRNCDAIVHTGDFIDFQTVANIEAMARILKDERMMFTPGSHEFNELLYWDKTHSDAELHKKHWQNIQQLCPTPLDFSVRWIKGLRLIALDNSLFHFSARQFDALKKELAGQKAPTVLLMHVPLYTPEFLEERTAEGKISDLVGIPSSDVPEWQRADETTFEMCRFIASNEQITAVLAGHLHCFWQGRLGPNSLQIVAPLGYDGEAVEIHLGQNIFGE